MSRLRIAGGKKLEGTVPVSGAKNAVLPLLSAALLCDGETVFTNCPELSDVEACIDILRHLGIRAQSSNGTVTVEGAAPANIEIPERLMRRMRSSVIFLGSILARRGKAAVSNPGGCELGPRPIDLHISALSSLGAEMTDEHGVLKFSAPDGLRGNTVNLAVQSVGATENTILAAVLAKGTTVINNAAREPEISALADFLNSAGANIKGAGSSVITIEGVKKLYGTVCRVIPDRIEAATFMAAAAVTGGDITLKNIYTPHMQSIIDAFALTGCKIDFSEHTLRIKAPARLQAIPYIKSQVYPAFPTDVGPLITAALATADGTSVFVEGIFENRYRYISELQRLGADIKIEGRAAIVRGKKHLCGAPCVCTDLRGGAALAVAALGAEGVTVLDDTRHISRGYGRFAEKLSLIGAQIQTEV